jgi:hypothetical protein
MPFTNPIVTGSGYLIRDNIKSSNFVHNVSGWQIRKDGFAEFNDIAIRGSATITSLTVNGQADFFPNPFSFRISNDNGATGILIQGSSPYRIYFQPDPSETVGETWNSGSVGVNTQNSGPGDEAFMLLQAPGNISIGNYAGLFMYGASTAHPTSRFHAGADEYIFSSPGVGTVDFNGTTSMAVTIGGTLTVNGNVTIGASGTLTVPGDTTLTTINTLPVTLQSGYSESTSPTSTFTTTETQTDTVTFSYKANKVYKLIWSAPFQSSVSGDIIQYGLREDTSGGARLGTSRVTLPTGTIDHRITFIYYWTAPNSNSTKTIVATAVRTGGTGNVFRNGTATQKSFLAVELVT